MKVWFLSAVVNNHVLPLCYTFTEKEMFRYLEDAPLMMELYENERLWLEEIEVNDLINCVSADWYFKMYNEG